MERIDNVQAVTVTWPPVVAVYYTLLITAVLLPAQTTQLCTCYNRTAVVKLNHTEASTVLLVP